MTNMNESKKGKKKSITLREFMEQNQRKEDKIPNLDQLSVQQHENLAWANVEAPKLYSMDNDISLFDDGEVLWHLDRFTSDESNIHWEQSHHHYDDVRYFWFITETQFTMIFFSSLSILMSFQVMKGIQSPFVYFGGLWTLFGWHIEDGNLNSINYLHRGEPKIWYAPSDFINIFMLLEDVPIFCF